MKAGYLFLSRMVFLILFFYTGELYAQMHFFRSFSLEEGLPQSEVWDILEDKRGNLWVGTNGGGVCRFNSFHFEVFNTSKGLPDNQVRHLFEDSKGNIWFFTFQGIAIYDGYQIRKLENPLLIKNNFARIYEEKNGRIWLYLFQNQNEYKLLRIDGEEITDTKNLPEFSALYAQNNVLGMFRSRKGVLHFDCNNGLYEFDGKTLSKSPLYSLPEFSEKGINRLIPVLEDHEEALWLAVPTQNAVKLFKGDARGVKEVQTTFNPGNIQNLGFEDSKHRIWFAEREGLVKIENGITTRFNQANGLPSTIIYSITEDHEGNIWIGTSGTGMIRFNGDRFLIFDTNSGLKSNIARSIFEDSKGHFWFGLVGGLQEFDGEKLKDYFFDRNPNLGKVKQMMEDKDGTLLLCTDAGLLRFKDGQIQEVSQEFGIPANTGVSYILFDGKAYWIGTWGAGVFRYESANNVKIFNTANGSLRHNIIHSLYLDSKKNIWMCTNLGLYQYTPDGKLNRFDNNNGMKKDLVMQAVEDKKGRLWVATYGGGIHILEGTKFSYLDSENSKLASSTVYSIISDQEQNLWVGTQYGIDKITLDENANIISIRNYNKYDGFLGVETNGASNYMDKSGNLWFGTIRGIMKYSPKEDHLYAKAPIVHITALRLFFRPTDWLSEAYDSFKSSTEPWFHLPVNLVLPYDSNHVSFDFEAIHYGSPEGIRYQWKMENVDKDWTPISDKTEASYPNLLPGKYTFKVRAMNKEGVWTEEPAVFSFEIRPPWWQLAWVQVLFLSIVVGGVFAGVRIRIMAIKAHQKELERLVAEKTIEIRTQNGEILAKNAELEQQKEEILVQSENLKEANKEIIEKKEIIERKNEDISSSIEYARRIQEAMLPAMDRIRAAISEFFILFQPRDVVSGDFYWFAEKIYPHSKKLIIACVDCTGHGVPGAFMSMIGDSLLNHIVHDKEIHEADQILNAMHKGIQQTLNQIETSNRDGMDISLAVLDIPNEPQGEIHLEFAGAKSVLIYCFGENKGILKGDKFPVGGEQLEKERIFSKHSLSFKKTNSSEHLNIYLSSDGFQDQFGGPKSKKFMTYRFRELLYSISSHKMEEQKSILEKTLQEWKGSLEQIDDILVIGFRI